MCNNKGTLDIEQLDVRETPLEILQALSKSRWPVSGGWGYSREDAVVIELEDGCAGVHLEYQFMECRSYLEAKKCSSKGMKVTGINTELIMQSLTFGEGGKPYDRLKMEVTVFLEGEKEIKYEEDGWFDISKFFGIN